MSPTTTRNLVSQSAGFALYAFTLAAHFLAAVSRGLIAIVVLWFAGVLTS